MNDHKTCHDRREAIAALVLGELNAQSTAELLKHIDTCQVCRNLHQTLTAEEETIRTVFEVIGEKMEATKDRLVKQLDNYPPQPSLPISSQRRSWGGLKIMKQVPKSAVAACIVFAIMYLGWISLSRNGSDTKEIMSGFSLFEQACAAEEILFSQQGIIHIVNHIIVQPDVMGNVLGSAESEEFAKTPNEAYDELNKYQTHNWLPMCSLQADGQLRFDQLQLPKGEAVQASCPVRSGTRGTCPSCRHPVLSIPPGCLAMHSTGNFPW